MARSGGSPWPGAGFSTPTTTARRAASWSSATGWRARSSRRSVGHSVEIRGVPYQVIGVLAPKGMLADGDEDDQAVVPIRTAQRRLFNLEWLNVVFVSAREADSMAAAAAGITELLTVRHGTTGEAGGLRGQNTARNFAMQQQATGTLGRLTTSLGGLAFAIGGTGILAVMLLSVRERTPEIESASPPVRRRATCSSSFCSRPPSWRWAAGAPGSSSVRWRRCGGGVHELAGGRSRPGDRGVLVLALATGLGFGAVPSGVAAGVARAGVAHAMTRSDPAVRPGPPPAVLIIDDDRALGDLLTEYLTPFGFAVRTALEPEAGLRALRADPPDLVILDLMLPQMDGLAVCRRIRETSRVPVIMLTARGAVADRIVGLEVGADDYLPKPFEPRELVARMQSVLRRAGPEAPEVVRSGPVEVNWGTRVALHRGTPVELTTAEFELLGFFVRQAGRVLSRTRIIEGTHGIDWHAFDRSVDVLVSRLRQKLGDDARRPALIRTVRGVGYSWVGGERDAR
ncbi:MAG: response regulator [Gemmatimonadales bacterium]